jgi:hypothetical protein
MTVTPYAIALLVALPLGGLYALLDWRRERREWERRCEEIAELLAQGHRDPRPEELGHAWRQDLRTLPETREPAGL